MAPPQDVENITTAPRHRPETRVREGFAAYRPPPALGSQPKLDLDRNGKVWRVYLLVGVEEHVEVNAVQTVNLAHCASHPGSLPLPSDSHVPSSAPVTG